MKEKVHHSKKRDKGLKSADKVIVPIWFDTRSLFSVAFPNSTHSTHVSLERSRRDEYFDTPHMFFLPKIWSQNIVKLIISCQKKNTKIMIKEL
jgi:hypothetical protein